MTRVIPGVFSAANNMADFTCAEATGRRYSIGTAGQMPRTISGRRSPGLAVNDAPIVESGAITRAMGRLLSEASPVNVAVMGCEATRPISNRVDVPEFPISSAVSGCKSPPIPTPQTCHRASCRTISAPIARIAAAVARTSSPSSSPSITDSPTASADSISARCEIDLSPGTVTVPASGPESEKARATTVMPRGFDSRDLLWQGRSSPSGLPADLPYFLELNEPMVKPEWGTKRTCPKCATRFYDLTKDDPVTCISCGNIWVPESILKSKQPLPFDEPKKELAQADADLGDDDLDIDVDEDAEKSPDDEVDLGDDDDLGVDTGPGEQEV